MSGYASVRSGASFHAAPISSSAATIPSPDRVADPAAQVVIADVGGYVEGGADARPAERSEYRIRAMPERDCQRGADPHLEGSAHPPRSLSAIAHQHECGSLVQSGNVKPAASPKPPRMSQPAPLLGISSPATLFSRRVTGPDVRRIVGQRPCRVPYSARPL